MTSLFQRISYKKFYKYLRLNIGNTNLRRMSSAANKLCMIPGPIEFHEDVLTAMSTKGTSHIDPSFIATFGESIELMRQVVLTKTGQPFIVSGSGTLGWDMVVCNTMEPEDEALIVNSGYFGDHFADCAETYGYKVTHVNAPEIGDIPTIESVVAALEKKKKSGKPFKLVNITHVDTSTGVLQDVKSLASKIREVSPNTLISVDGVCSIAAEELRMDDWDIDLVLTASQKALGVPSGLCVLVASQRAIKAFEERKVPVRNYFASWKNWLPVMKAYEARKPSYFATPPVNLIIALNVSLRQITKQGMDKRFELHRASSNAFKDTISSWGLKLVPKSRQLAANTMSAIYFPEGISGPDLLPLVVKRGVVLAGGLHKDIKSKYFRVGHMGISSVEGERKHMDKLTNALKEALKEAGFAC